MAEKPSEKEIEAVCEAAKKLNIKSSSKDNVEENFFYVLGGITNSNCDHIYIKKQKKWYPLPPCGRSYFNCCVIDKKMYLVGGRVEGIPQNTISLFAHKTWSNIPMKLLRERSESGIAVIENKIYSIGGYGKASALVETYDVEKNTLTLLKPKLQQPRYGHAVVTIDQTMYALGGHKLNKYFNSMERFKIGGELRWLSCEGMHRRRAYFAAVALPPFIYAFGGCGGPTNSDEINRLDSAERYDTRSNEWTLIARMPSARSNISAVKWGKRILIIGGLDDKKRKLREILSYNPDTNSYELFHTKLPEWRFAHCSASE